MQLVQDATLFCYSHLTYNNCAVLQKEECVNMFNAEPALHRAIANSLSSLFISFLL